MARVAQCFQLQLVAASKASSEISILALPVYNKVSQSQSLINKLSQVILLKISTDTSL